MRRGREITFAAMLLSLAGGFGVQWLLSCNDDPLTGIEAADVRAVVFAESRRPPRESVVFREPPVVRRLFEGCRAATGGRDAGRAGPRHPGAGVSKPCEVTFLGPFGRRTQDCELWTKPVAVFFESDDGPVGAYWSGAYAVEDDAVAARLAEFVLGGPESEPPE